MNSPSCARTVLLTLLLPVFLGYGQVHNTTRLQRIDGREIPLAEYLDKGPVYMTFWATWCQPCVQELRALKSFVNENRGKPFTILAVNQDSPKSLAKVRAFVRAQDYPFPVLLDPNMQLFQSYNGQNLPFSVLLDRTGAIVSMRTGYLAGDEKEIAEEILRLLK